MSKFMVYPLERWEKAVRNATERIKRLDDVSDVKVGIFPNDEFPLAGMNPNILVYNTPVPKEKLINGSHGGLMGRETKGYAIIELILHQPGFVHHGKVGTNNSEITDKFKLHIHIPREYPCHLGYGVIFVQDDNFKIPSYQNIMKRVPGTHFLDGIAIWSGAQMAKAYPEGCMCHNSLNNPQNKPVQAVTTIKQYLKVNPKDFEQKRNNTNQGRGNDGGFDPGLYEFFHENHRTLSNLIHSYRPGPGPGPTPGPGPGPTPGPGPRPPPPPPPKIRPKPSPPPPPPPPRR